MADDSIQSADKIWKAWKKNELRCNRCDNHDDNLHFRAKLSTNDDADVMIIGLEPNARDRTAKNASDISGLEVESHHNKDLAEVDYLQDVLDVYYDPNEDWPSGRFVGNLIEHSDLTQADIYLTNDKKCGNIEKGGNIPPEEVENMNQKACTNCKQYLPSEIEFVDPSAIVLCGKRVVKHINEFYHMDLPEECAKKALQSKRSDDREFVVAPNFGRYGLNLSQHHPKFDGKGTEKAFAKRLGDKLIGLVNR